MGQGTVEMADFTGSGLTNHVQQRRKAGDTFPPSGRLSESMAMAGDRVVDSGEGNQRWQGRTESLSSLEHPSISVEFSRGKSEPSSICTSMP